MKTITLVRSLHAPLYQRYDLRTGQFEPVGDIKGTYGREDKATGAEYRCLGESVSKKKVQYRSDLTPGMFYSENVFIWGKDEDTDKPLHHLQIEDFCLRLRYGSTKRVILPNGFNRGIMTWCYGVYFSPVEMQPNWEHLPAIIKQQIPNAKIAAEDYLFHNCIEVTI